MSRDMDDLLDSDKQKVQKAVRNYRQGGGIKDSIHPPKVLEQICWTLGLLTILGMVAVLPWVGVDKVIPGTAWLGISLTLAILFGVGGFTIRMARAGFQDADRQVSQKFERGR